MTRKNKKNDEITYYKNKKEIRLFRQKNWNLRENPNFYFEIKKKEIPKFLLTFLRAIISRNSK